MPPPITLEEIGEKVTRFEKTVTDAHGETDKKVADLSAKLDTNVRSFEDFKKQVSERKDFGFNVGNDKSKTKDWSFARYLNAQLRKREGEGEQAWTNAKAETERDIMVAFREEMKTERAMSSVVDNAGGFLVPDAIAGFGEMLRAQAVCFQLGASEISTNSSPLFWNRQTTASTVYYTGEGVAPTASDLAFDRIQLLPHSGKALIRISRELIQRGDPAVDSIIRNDLMRQLVLNTDLQMLRGPVTGMAGSPTGIVQSASVGSDTTAATAASQLAIMIRVVKAANGIVEGRTGWAMHPVMEQRIMALASSNSLLFTNPSAGYAAETLKILGAPYKTTTQLASSNGTANQAQIIFGDWSQVALVRWAPGVEIRFSDQVYFSTNEIGVLAIDSHDVLVKHPESFCFNNSLTS